MAAFSDVQACIFDAYGTLFDVASAAAHARDELGAKWQPLADLWRAKQLQYTWLRSLMGRHADFRQVTADALDFALASMDLADTGLRERLMQLYLRLDAYPDAREALQRLKASGLRLAILSNGEPGMLASACASSGLGALLDAVLSVEAVGVFKPHPAVYRLPVQAFGLPPERMCFVSSNGWDAHAAKANGYRVAWCNRVGQVPENIPERPDAVLSSLAALPDLLSG